MTPGRRTSARFAIFDRDLISGMGYQVKSKLTALAVNINPVAKTFCRIEIHFSPSVVSQELYRPKFVFASTNHFFRVGRRA